MSNKVPVLNLQEQFSGLAPELEQAIMSVLRSGNYILGEKGLELEKEIAKLCGCQYGIGVANGTDALELALWALDIGPGDEVITPSFTFAATAEAIAMRGAKPVFVEVEAKTFNIDSARIEAAHQLAALQSIWLELKRLYGTHSPDKSGMIQQAVEEWLKRWDGPERHTSLDNLLQIRADTRRRQYKKSP